MTNFISHNNPEALSAALHAEQNAIESRLREQTLEESLSRDHIHHWQSSSVDTFSELRKDFMAEKRGLNMGQCFALALDPRYFDKIHVVELGLTERPGQQGEIDGLRHEYQDLKHWMQQEGLIEDELPRETSGRGIEFRASEVAPEHTVVIRNRPLIFAEIPKPHAHIAIAKRMVFSMPNSYLRQLVAMAERPTNESGDQIEELTRCIEKAMELKSPSIDAIRTGYYMVSGRP